MLKAAMYKVTDMTEFVQPKVKSKAAAAVMASGDSLDHHALLLLGAARPRGQNVILVVRDGAVVGGRPHLSYGVHIPGPRGVVQWMVRI
jgi:hypothetical protein